jgi:protein AbiQ
VNIVRLKFYTVDGNYNEYLRKIDFKVQDVSVANKKDTRPFVGILLTVNNIKYIAPLASPKPKHQSMKNQLDFIKINSGLWGAINFNNMIPVTDKLINLIDINSQNKKYKELLSNQLTWCNSNKDKIIDTANKLYLEITSKKTNTSLLRRCCDFKLLEERLSEYISIEQNNKKNETVLNNISQIENQTQRTQNETNEISFIPNLPKVQTKNNSNNKGISSSERRPLNDFKFPKEKQSESTVQNRENQPQNRNNYNDFSR